MLTIKGDRLCADVEKLLDDINKDARSGGRKARNLDTATEQLLMWMFTAKRSWVGFSEGTRAKCLPSLRRSVGYFSW